MSGRRFRFEDKFKEWYASCVNFVPIVFSYMKKKKKEIFSIETFPANSSRILKIFQPIVLFTPVYCYTKLIFIHSPRINE